MVVCDPPCCRHALASQEGPCVPEYDRQLQEGAGFISEHPIQQQGSYCNSLGGRKHPMLGVHCTR